MHDWYLVNGKAGSGKQHAASIDALLASNMFAPVKLGRPPKVLSSRQPIKSKRLQLQS